MVVHGTVGKDQRQNRSSGSSCLCRHRIRRRTAGIRAVKCESVQFRCCQTRIRIWGIPSHNGDGTAGAGCEQWTSCRLLRCLSVPLQEVSVSCGGCHAEESEHGRYADYHRHRVPGLSRNRSFHRHCPLRTLQYHESQNRVRCGWNSRREPDRAGSQPEDGLGGKFADDSIRHADHSCLSYFWVPRRRE